MKNVVIGGDFNVRMGSNGDQKSLANGDMLRRWCRHVGLTIVNNTDLCHGTHSRVQVMEHDVQRSTVDYVLVSESVMPSVRSLHLETGGQCGSDHKPLVLSLS